MQLIHAWYSNVKKILDYTLDIDYTLVYEQEHLSLYHIKI